MKIEEIAKKYNRPMNEFLQRSDGRIEWICKHGVGHTVYSPINHPSWYRHGCDGCCEKLKQGGKM